MPAVFLERLPLPSLQAYTTVSILLLSCSVYYAVQVTSQIGWRLNSTVSLGVTSSEKSPPHGNSTVLLDDLTFDDLILDHPLIRRLVEISYFMVREPLCIWTLINMAYCCLILVGKVIQKLVFGELRVSEQQHIKDKFWNFVFYKFIFIFGVMNVQFMDEVVLWCSWFSVLGFLHLLAQLCKDRFEYLSFSPTTPKWTHIRLLALLCTILAISCSLFAVCVFVGLHAGINTFAFMAAECALVTVRTLYVITRYSIHLWDINHDGVWERRAAYVYYTELVFELTALATDFFHHLHMLLWGNIFLSMASLVIAMQLRCLFYEIQHRIKKYKNYLRIVKHMEHNYPMASSEELEKNSDDCAICWDHMESARKLPCGHLFHNSCLRSWLEQDTSCPTCRKALSDSGEVDPSTNSDGNNHNTILGGLGGQDDTPARTVNQTTNHFFHFDGSRYVSWLPSFSVEVTHTNLLGERTAAIQTSQLDSMARQVQQMFPSMPLSLIMDDLRATRSVELTIENILDERLIPPPSAIFQGNRSMSSASEASSPENTSQTHSPEELEEALTLPTTNQISYLEDTVLPPSSDVSDVEAETEKEPHLVLAAGGLGSRFSKSPKERERMLARRKEDLIKLARRKYMSKINHVRNDSSGEQTSDSVVNSLKEDNVEERWMLPYRMPHFSDVHTT